MASITLAIPDKIKEEMKKLSWVNWSELARKELIKQKKKMEIVEKLKRIVAKSKLTEKDIEELSEKIKSSMHKRLKNEGLI